MSGVQELEQLRKAGFSGAELTQYEAQQRRQLSGAGFSETEINDYFGVKDLDMSRVQQHFDDAGKQLREAPADAEGVRKAVSAKDYLEAGWQMSVTGLDFRGQLPDVTLDKDAPWYGRALSGLATVAGDMPAMVVGGLFGGAGGAATGTAIAPGPGTVVGGVAGAGGGALALPAMLREELITNMRDGRIKDSRDFLTRALAISWEGLKGFVVGGTTAGIG